MLTLTQVCLVLVDVLIVLAVSGYVYFHAQDRPALFTWLAITGAIAMGSGLVAAWQVRHV